MQIHIIQVHTDTCYSSLLSNLKAYSISITYLVHVYFMIYSQIINV